MLETTKYMRKKFFIDAVQVTADNFAEVAQWCSGEVLSDPSGKQFVKVRVHRPLNDRQTKAYVGDWVLYAGTGYKVYTSKAFNASFELASTDEQPNRADVAIAEEAAIIVVTEQPAKKSKAS